MTNTQPPPLAVVPFRLGPRQLSGLRQNWITGEDPDSDVTFDLDSGAGLGSASLTLTVYRGDAHVTEIVDIREVAAVWVAHVLATWPETAPTETAGEMS
jgi:hypothetical protein